MPLPFWYAGSIAGAALLAADLAGLLRANPRRVRLWRSVAAAVATFIGLAPIVAEAFGYLGSGSGFYWLALAYPVGAAVFLVGILDGEQPRAAWLRRAGYLVLLALAFLPSWVLIGFAPAIGLAGLGLVQLRSLT